MLARLDEIARVGHISPIYRAWVHLGLGETDQVLEWLDRAVDLRDPHILHLPAKPVYDSLRDDARFGALLRRMRLRD